MKKKLMFIIPLLLIILISVAVAAERHNQAEEQRKARETQIIADAHKLIKIQEQVSNSNLRIANDKLNVEHAKRVQICAIIKPSKLVYPVTLCQ
jgi:hypothetical protein